jgi:hypothetical protein
MTAGLDFRLWFAIKLIYAPKTWRSSGAGTASRGFQFLAMCMLIQVFSGCVSMPGQQPAIASSPAFDPMTFFSGRTEGRGILKKILSSPIPVTVHGRGKVDEAGILILDQDVHEGDKPPRKRSWRIHRIGSNIYRGSLTDAKGPITITVDGNRMHISFTMDGGFPVDQYIFLGADGQSAKNIMAVRKLGMRVAVLEEEIVKISE